MAATTNGARGEWWIESPEVVPTDDPSFLCDVCKHVNFRYLLFELPLQFVSDEIPLDSYSRILEKHQCAFCRLVKHTIDNVVGGDAFPTEYESKTVIISMKVVVAAFDRVSDPRQLILQVDPPSFNQGRPPSLEIQHVVKDGWFKNDEKGQLIPSQIDFLLPLYWNRVCRKSVSSLHEDHLMKTDNHILPPNFRLIDTEKMCIVPADSSLEYTALGYTWGKDKQFKLFQNNYQEILKENALVLYEHRIPQTIKDAMFLVKRLGDRYLWVDALCILQDLECKDKKV